MASVEGSATTNATARHLDLTEAHLSFARPRRQARRQGISDLPGTDQDGHGTLIGRTAWDPVRETKLTLWPRDLRRQE